MSEPDLKLFGRGIKLTGAIFADTDEQWLIYLPGEGMRRGLTPLTWDSEQWSSLLHQTDNVPVEALVQEDNKQPGKAVIRKAQRQLSRHVSWQVFRRDEFTCRYCGNDEVPMTVDHLITWESGGPTTLENLLTSCGPCNNARGETPYAEWLSSKYYQKAARGLLNHIIERNKELIDTLASIPISPIVVKGKKRKR